jgi:hypothetical protein
MTKTVHPATTPREAVIRCPYSCNHFFTDGRAQTISVNSAPPSLPPSIHRWLFAIEAN